jgi:hemoglobin
MTPEETPYQLLGGERVRAIAESFYEAMARDEPALARLHPCDAEGRVEQGTRERFALFLAGWLGGPQDYVAQHGHPRLRMRHGRVPVNVGSRDAWLRSMATALDQNGVQGPLRVFLDGKFKDLADFLRNAH